MAASGKRISGLLLHLQLLAVLVLNFNYRQASGQSQNEVANQIFCTDQWCEDAQVKCSEIKPNCTKIGFRRMKSPERCNCCEYCFDYLEQEADCPTQTFAPPVHLCGPALECRKSADEDDRPLERCEPMQRTDIPPSCNQELIAYNKSIEDGSLGVAQYKPDCDAHGDYMARQCLPGSICFCSNGAGERIFGTGTVTSRMNCACARDYDRVRRSGLDGNWSHCLANGNYDELQCSKRTRTCYCISKPQTGVPLQMWTRLPCYNRALHGSTYLRPCELRAAEIGIQITEAGFENKTLIYADQPECGPDGNYSPVQSLNSHWICVDPDGHQLFEEDTNLPYEVEKTDLNPGGMNCNCARARLVIGNSGVKPKCCQNGSYRRWQCTGSTCYCVDPGTGKQEMSRFPFEVHIDNVETLPCFENACD